MARRGLHLAWRVGAVVLVTTVPSVFSQTSARTLPPATTEVSAQVVPARVEATVRRGQSFTQDVTLMNQGNVPVIVRPRWSDWRIDEEGAVSLLPSGSTRESLDSTVTIEPREFSLLPGQMGSVRVAVTLPAAGPATRWGLLLSEVRPASMPTEARGPRAVALLGTTLYLSCVPANQITPELAGLRAGPLGADSIGVTVRVRNAGDRQFHLSGKVAIADSNGVERYTGELGGGVVLPRSTRRFTWRCTGGLAPGRHRVTVALDTGEPELLVGETMLDWRAPWPTPAAPLAETR